MTADAVPAPNPPIPVPPNPQPELKTDPAVPVLTTPALALPPAPPPFDLAGELRHWLRLLLARNPFYILSAALLLWSMRQLSLDARIFPDELPQLIFNFSAFQVYEVLLAGTAIVLARRRVWYDSGLLVGLENLFICVPFLLVSQALLLENWIALVLCLTGCALACGRVGALKRGLTEMNAPRALLWSGAVLLCFNLAWPLLIRRLHQNVSAPAWDHRGLTLIALAWNWIMPVAVALAALLPIRRADATFPAGESSSNQPALEPRLHKFLEERAGERRLPLSPPRDSDESPFYSWPCFPFVALLLWIAGTCVHLYCVSYVYDLPWTAGWLTPALWMAAWMVWLQVEARGRSARSFWPKALLLPPLLVVLASAATGRWTLCLTLAGLNAAVCAGIGARRRYRLAWPLCAVSAVLAAGFGTCVWQPHSALESSDVNLVPALAAAALCYGVVWGMVSARPKVGIAAGLCVVIGLMRLLPATPTHLNLAAQAGLIFILLHSLRWDAASLDAAKARKICAIYWLAHTIIWVAADSPAAIYGTLGGGVSVLAVYGCARVVFGQWGPRVIGYSAVIVVCWGPFYRLGQSLMHAPHGLLTLFGSFALFGIGTLAALRKGRPAAGGKPQKC